MENEIQTITQTNALTETKATNCEAINVVKCLNCGTEFEGKFCPVCGQNAETGRFTMRFIFENLLAAFISKDGGIWFTFKNLFTRPGDMIVEILNGKRRRYFSPFPTLIFVLTVYILLSSLTGSRSNYREAEEKLLKIENTERVEAETPEAANEQSVNELKKLIGKGLKFYNNHYTAIYMLTLPLFLFAARLCYGKSNRKRYYRAEYLVAIAYSMVIVIIYLWLVSLIYPLSETVSDTMGLYMPFVTAIAFTVCLRKMMGFSIVKTAWRSILTVALYYTTLFFIGLIVGILFLIIFFGGKITGDFSI